jgi:hypothetical protein
MKADLSKFNVCLSVSCLSLIDIAFFNLKMPFYKDPVLGKGYLVKDVSIANDKVKVTTDEGHSEHFDAVVITMPVAQIMQLQGDIASLIGESKLLV